MIRRTLAIVVAALLFAAPAPAAMSQQAGGTWVLAVELGAGQGGEATFVLVQEGEKITGTYTGALGEDVPVAGKVTEEGIEFSFDSQAGEVTYKGKIDGDTMEGTCVYGQLGEGTFKGERE